MGRFDGEFLQQETEMNFRNAPSLFRKPGTWIAAGMMLAVASFTGCNKSTDPEPEGCATTYDSLHVPLCVMVDSGEALYQGYCTGCHGIDGRGSAGGTPPHANADWFMNNKRKTIVAVLAGFGDSIFVNGMSYQSEMPSFGGAFSDREVASILSYLRAVLNDSTVTGCATYNPNDPSTFDENGFAICQKTKRTEAQMKSDTVAVWEVKAVRDSIEAAQAP
jgi:hypothetical protein